MSNIEKLIRMCGFKLKKPKRYTYENFHSNYIIDYTYESIRICVYKYIYKTNDVISAGISTVNIDLNHFRREFGDIISNIQHVELMGTFKSEEDLVVFLKKHFKKEIRKNKIEEIL